MPAWGSQASRLSSWPPSFLYSEARHSSWFWRCLINTQAPAVQCPSRRCPPHIPPKPGVKSVFDVWRPPGLCKGEAEPSAPALGYQEGAKPAQSNEQEQGAPPSHGWLSLQPGRGGRPEGLRPQVSTTPPPIHLSGPAGPVPTHLSET